MFIIETNATTETIWTFDSSLFIWEYQLFLRVFIPDAGKADILLEQLDSQGWHSFLIDFSVGDSVPENFSEDLARKD